MAKADTIKEIPGSVQIKQSTVAILKSKYQKEDVTNEAFIEWWQRKYGLEYPIEIIRG